MDSQSTFDFCPTTVGQGAKEIERRVLARREGKIRQACVAFTVRISGVRYYGIEQHDSLLAALQRARQILARSAVVIRRRKDGRRFSVAELAELLRKESEQITYYSKSDERGECRFCLTWDHHDGTPRSGQMLHGDPRKWGHKRPEEAA